MKDGIEEMNRLCGEITGIKEARNITIEDIIDSEYWEDEKKRDLIFGDKGEGFSYWLASRCVLADSGYARFYVRCMGSSGSVGYSGLFGSYGDAGIPSCAVRPVFYLKSGEINHV